MADIKSNGEEWFYTKIVKDHFINPRNLATSEHDIKSISPNGTGEVGSPACGDVMKLWIHVDKNKKITDCRWKTFGSILPESKILMSDFTTEAVNKLHRGDKIIDSDTKENFIDNILTKEYSGKILSISLSTSKFYNFLVTPNHPIPYIKREDVAKVKRFSTKRWHEVSQKKIDVATVKEAPALELKEGDYMLFNFPSNIKDISALDEDMCTLLGYYVSDGNTPSRNRTIFYFNLTEQEYISEIEDILKRKGFDYKIFKRNTENVICIQINNSQIVSILNKYGGKPSNKIFSKEIIFLPPKKQEKIINAYISGDGWILNQNEKWKPQYFISTSIEQLAYQLQLMIARTGYFAPIHKREPREFICRGKCYKNSGEINLIFRKNTKYSRIKYNKKNSAFLIPITSIREIDYTGKIYDLSLVYSPNIYKVKGISIHNCASAIASTSMLSVMITEKGGMHIEEAIKITPQDILKKLGGLPPRKIHCSVLGDQALRAAIDDYSKKN